MNQDDSNSKQISAFSRLNKLPAVFDLLDVEYLFDIKRKDAIQYCMRWRKQNLIKQLGPKVGVFYNILVDRNAHETRRMEALDKYFGFPVVVIGGTALHEHGWTTQIPRQIDIAVPVSRGKTSIPELNDFNAFPRYLRWFHKLKDTAEEGVGGFLVASPAMALADVYLANLRGRSGGGWVPDHDDIDLPDEDALEDVRECLRILGANDDEVEELTNPFLEQIENDKHVTVKSC